MIIAVAFALAVVVFIDAKARDTSPFMWAVTFLLAGALFLRPIGLILGIVIWYRFRPKGPLKSCHHCRRPYLEELATCPHCKRAVKKDCHRCLAAVPVEVRVCPDCGTRLIGPG